MRNYLWLLIGVVLLVAIAVFAAGEWRDVRPQDAVRVLADKFSEMGWEKDAQLLHVVANAIASKRQTSLMKHLRPWIVSEIERIQRLNEMQRIIEGK